MATSTTNLGLTKPAGTDKIRIAQINGNMDILDEKIGAVGNTSLQAQVTSQNQAIANNEGAMAFIVGNTNTTGATLAVGQFVYVKEHSTIAEGLRTVTASISANGNITTSNTTACPEGGLNALNSKKVNYSDITFDIISGSTNTPNLLGGCKFEPISFDSGRTGGFTFNYTMFAFIVMGRGGYVGVYLLDGFSNVLTIKAGENINITCSNKTGNITVTNASYQYGFVMYC